MYGAARKSPPSLANGVVRNIEFGEKWMEVIVVYVVLAHLYFSSLSKFRGLLSNQPCSPFFRLVFESNRALISSYRISAGSEVAVSMRQALNKIEAHSVSR